MVSACVCLCVRVDRPLAEEERRSAPADAGDLRLHPGSAVSA
jgi:hypothetical protein